MKILDFIGIVFCVALSLSIPGALTGMVLDGMKTRSKQKRFLSLLTIWLPYLWLMGIFTWTGQGDHMVIILVGALWCWGRFLCSEEFKF
jgi:hypothetical protein